MREIFFMKTTRPKNKHLLIFLLVITLFQSSFTYAARFDCRAIFSAIYSALIHTSSKDDKTKRIAAFRKEMIKAWLFYQKKHPEPWNRQDIGSEKDVIDPKFGGGGHVINLAGASNTLRIRYLLPLARHIHTADIIDQPFNHNVMTEYLARLHALAPDAEVEIVQEGFYSTFRKTFGTGIEPINEKKFASFQTQLRESAHARKPLIARVEWNSKSMGKVERFFYFHPIDLARPHEIRQLIGSIPMQEQLVGMTMFGVGASSSSSRAKLAINMGVDVANGYWMAGGPQGSSLVSTAYASEKRREVLRIISGHLSAPPNPKLIDEVGSILRHSGFDYRQISDHVFEATYRENGQTNKILITYKEKLIKTTRQLDEVSRTKGMLIGLQMTHKAAMELTFGPLFDRLEDGGYYITADHGVNIDHLLPKVFQHITAISKKRDRHLDPDQFYSRVEVYQKTSSPK